MACTSSDSFVIEFKLKTSSADKIYLQECFSAGWKIYNTLVRHCRKQLASLRQDKTYRNLLAKYHSLKGSRNQKTVIQPAFLCKSTAEAIQTVYQQPCGAENRLRCLERCGESPVWKRKDSALPQVHGVRLPIEKEQRRLLRKMDRSRRTTNPQNYNVDGTVKKGGKRWHKSKNYRRMEMQYASLCRKRAAALK